MTTIKKEEEEEEDIKKNQNIELLEKRMIRISNNNREILCQTVCFCF